MNDEIIYFILGISSSSVFFLLLFAWFYVHDKRWKQRHEIFTSNLSRLIKETEEAKKRYKNGLRKHNKQSSGSKH